MSLSSNTFVKDAEENCEPWSVLKISGIPFVNAHFKASTQKMDSRVFDNSQAKT